MLSTLKPITLMLALASALSLLSASSLQAVDAELAKFHGLYTNALNRIETTHKYKAGQFAQTYIKALEKAEEKTELYGDVEGFETVGEEMVRFKSEMTLTEKHLHEEPLVLAERQTKALNNWQLIQEEREAKLSRLQVTYLKALNDLKLRVTSKKYEVKVEEALKQLKARPEFIPPQAIPPE